MQHGSGSSGGGKGWRSCGRLACMMQSEEHWKTPLVAFQRWHTAALCPCHGANQTACGTHSRTRT